MIGWRAVVATACTALLAACATPSRDGVAVPGENLSGRLAVRVDAAAATAERSMSAGFELQGQPRAGRLNLTTPLGTMLAQARWAPGQVLLVTPQGERAYASLDALTRDVLGESVPVAALFDWLNGRPWPDAPSTRTTTASGPGFRQLGWVIDLARFDEASIAAVREQPPVVTVRIKLDRP